MWKCRRKHSSPFLNWINIYKVMMHSREEQLESFSRLLDVMDELRAKCPWDREQTFESLRHNTIEETYELCDAIIDKDMGNIKKELGDILLHIVFYAKMASETDDFDIKDVCDALCSKLIYRHPHVFGDAVANEAGEVVRNWEQLKRKEKGGNKTVLSGVPESLPSLIKSYRIQEKAAAVGFDLEQKEDVWKKVHEELEETESALSKGDDVNLEEEIGDTLFALVNAARLYGVEPDNALEKTNKKFMRRFNYIESESVNRGKDLKQMSLKEMDELWDEAKRLERQSR